MNRGSFVGQQHLKRGSRWWGMDPLGCLLLWGATLVSASAAEVVRLANARCEIAFDAGNGALRALVDRQSGHPFATGASALWSVDAILDGQVHTLGPAQATRFEYARSPDGGEVRLSWSGFTPAGAGGLRVEVRARLAGDEPDSRWHIAISKPRDAALTQVRFPLLDGLAAQPEEFLAVPAWTGELLAEPRKGLTAAKGKGRRLAWEYPGRLSLQCLALYRRDGPGMYLACEDAAAYRKTFVARGDGEGGIGLEVEHLPESGARGEERYAPAYPVVVGVFRGDWVTAAERYRAWGTQQRWARESRLRRGEVPAWVPDTALWVWNRGRSEGVLPPAGRLRRELGLPVSVLWHWWHGCAYDTGFPEYLPPREGAESFGRALAAAQAEGVRAMVYMNQRLWGLTTPSWTAEGAERFAVKGADGTYRKEVYNTFTGEACVSMCMGTEFWREKYAGLAEQVIRQFRVDGIYMDQACTSLACHDASHGHPLGGGRFWMDGFRVLSTDIRQRAAGVRPPALAGEGSGEAWLPYLDLMLSLQVSRERYAAPAEGWEAIPFFPAVYHPYAVQFGNYSSLTMPPYDDLWPAATAPKVPLALLDRQYSRQFRVEQARALVWGQQPMLANFRPNQLEERAAEIAYVLRLARLRRHGVDYLLHGEFLRPPEVLAAPVETPMSRLSIYAGQKGGLTHFVKALPPAYAGAWRAPDGRVALVVASVLTEPQDVVLAFDPAGYGLPPAARAIRIDESGRRGAAGEVREGRLRVALPADGACLIELAAP
ncbi:MAG: hypothetical protein HZC55_02475 [Verrucomicrobia bacterium]|nr:hypothetical protein [Verrucomicrobiota bacterium]